jgi:polysaccharide biosynthesis protein PslJ
MVTQDSLPLLDRRLSMGPSWPLWLLFLAFPLWWALGFAAIVWPLMAVPIAAAVFMRGWTSVPRGFGLWILFLVWMVASGTQLEDTEQWIAFTYRVAIYLSATLLFLYVFNAPREQLPARQVTGILTGFWSFAVVGGFLALAFPDGAFTSAAEVLLPPGLSGNAFIYELIHPEFAQVHEFLGYPIPRPKAPFVYTNEWGANIALLTPFVLATWRTVRRSSLRLLVGTMLVASVVPIVVSVNRGLWLSLGLGLIYAAIRLAIRGRIRGLYALAGFIVLSGLLIIATPLARVIGDRLATPHSNATRGSLYVEAAEGVLDSPLLGYGSPRESERNPTAPPVGTHGQFWLVLFSHGIPGAALFLAWLGYAFWQSQRRRSTFHLWMSVVLLIALIQLPYYGMLPVPIHLVMLATALSWREASTELRSERPLERSSVATATPGRA